MLTSIDVKFIFDSTSSTASLRDKGLFSCANILQIADVVCRVVVLSLLFLDVFGQYFAYFFLVKRVNCSVILYPLPKQLKPRPLVFSVNRSVFWQLCCEINVISYISQNSSKFGR